MYAHKKRKNMCLNINRGYICNHIYTYIHTHIYIHNLCCIYTHIHTHTHTYSLVSLRGERSYSIQGVMDSVNVHIYIS